MSVPHKRSDLTRPVLFEEKENMAPAELFQHIVLRPVLKFQNELLCITANDACLSLDPAFKTLVSRKQRSLLDKTLTGNQALRNMLAGIILGMMDPEQLQVFLGDRKDLTKRIHTMIRERILDQYHLFL